MRALCWACAGLLLALPSCRREESPSGGPDVAVVPLEYYCYSMALSPDGRRLAVNQGMIYDTAKPPSMLQVFNVSTGREVWRVKDVGHHNIVAFSPDGNTVAITGQNIDLYDARDGRKRKTLESGSILGLTEIQFLPDGKSLIGATGYQDPLIVYELPDGRSQQVRIDRNPLDLPQGRRIAITADGKLLASCGPGPQVYLWETGSWKKNGALATRMDKPYVVRFSPDGRLLICSGRDSLIPGAAGSDAWFVTEVLDVPSGTSKYSVSDLVNYLVFTRDSELLIHDGFGCFVIRKAVTGEILSEVPTGQDMNFGLDLSADENVLAVAGRVDLGRRSEVKLWDFKALRASLPRPTSQPSQFPVASQPAPTTQPGGRAGPPATGRGAAEGAGVPLRPAG